MIEIPDNAVWIPGNVPSLKNSKQIAWGGPRCRLCGKGRFPVLVSSKRVKQWTKETKVAFVKNRERFHNLLIGIEPPYLIEFKFYRKSRHKFDFTNATDTVQDSMVYHKWLEDDNHTIIRPCFADPVHDKDNPGVLISVL